MFVKIDHLNMSVKNLDDSLAFYSELFDFTLLEKGVAMDGRNYLIIGKKDFALCLYEKVTLSNIDIENSPLDHFGFRINDKELFLSHCKRHGVDFHYGGAVPYKKSTSWYIKDPSGYEIEVSFALDGMIAFA